MQNNLPDDISIVGTFKSLEDIFKWEREQQKEIFAKYNIGANLTEDIKTVKLVDGILFGPGVSSFNRFDAFLSIRDKLQGKLYWYALRAAYQDSDNLFGNPSVKTAFTENEASREYLMNTRERKYLSALPDQLTIFRGMTIAEFESGNWGISWTLRERVAKNIIQSVRNFETNHLPKTIHQISIAKDSVIAYFSGRKEYEIIYIKSQPKTEPANNWNF